MLGCIQRDEFDIASLVQCVDRATHETIGFTVSGPVDPRMVGQEAYALSPDQVEGVGEEYFDPAADLSNVARWTIRVSGISWRGSACC